MKEVSLVVLSKRAGLVRVGPMEVCYELLGMSELCCEDPRGLFVGAFVSGPVDQIEELAGPTSPINLGVEDFEDFVLRFAVNLDRWWRCLDASRDGVQSHRFQLRDLKYQMDGAHRVW